MASFDEYFSVLALFILFRETIEASIICSVLLQFLNRAKPALKRAVWYGVAAGVGVSIIFGVIFIAVYYTAKDNLFKGKSRDWFKGIISWIAAILITILGFAMLRFLGWEAKWKRKLAAAVAEKIPEAALADPDATSTDESAPPATKDCRDTTSGSENATRTSDDTTSRIDSGGQPDRLKSQQQPSSSLTSPGLGALSSSSDSDAAACPKKADGVASNAVVPAPLDDVEANAIVAADAGEPEKCDQTPGTRKEMTNIFVLVFTTVVREGIESVVFLGGLGNVKLTAIPLPAFVGIVAGCLVGIFLYYSGKQVKHIKWLVIGMAIIIFFIAAGQVNLGTDALMKAGAFGEISVWMDERPWYMLPVYDWSACCSDLDPNGSEPTDEQNRRRFFALARAIFGYQDKGTPVEIIIYVSYWVLIFIIIGFKHWRGTLFDADYKYTREQRRLAKEAKRQAEEEAEEQARLAKEEADSAEAMEAAGRVLPGSAYEPGMVSCAITDPTAVGAAAAVEGGTAADVGASEGAAAATERVQAPGEGAAAAAEGSAAAVEGAVEAADTGAVSAEDVTTTVEGGVPAADGTTKPSAS